MKEPALFYNGKRRSMSTGVLDLTVKPVREPSDKSSISTGKTPQVSLLAKSSMGVYTAI